MCSDYKFDDRERKIACTLSDDVIGLIERSYRYIQHVKNISNDNQDLDFSQEELEEIEGFLEYIQSVFCDDED